jgi:hypothetical protein
MVHILYICGKLKIMQVESVEHDIIASLDEVKAHIDGKIDLPNAKDILL